MNVDPHLDTLTTPTPQAKDFKPFVDLIFDACQEIQRRFNAPPYVVGQEAADILYWSFVASRPDDWVRRFNDARKKALKYWRDPRAYWGTHALAQYTPAIEKECRESIRDFDPEKYLIKTSDRPSPQRIAPDRITKPEKKPPRKRGELWKLDPRWDHLWDSSRAVFLEILRRTRYPKRPENFPWSQSGVQSLAKFTGFSERHVKRVLHQLQLFGLIKRFVKGNTFEGASKYFVFLTPKMSGAFKTKSLHAKKHPLSKKRTSTIR